MWGVWGLWGVWGRCVSKFGNQVVTHSTFTRSRVDKPTWWSHESACHEQHKQIRCFAETSCLLPITLHYLSFSVRPKTDNRMFCIKYIVYGSVIIFLAQIALFCHYNKHSQELGHSAKALVGSANTLLVAQKCPCVTMTTSESRNFSQAQSSPILAPMQCICCVWIFFSRK